MSVSPFVMPGGLPIRIIGGALGVWMAYNKRRNMLLWGILCFYFPPVTILLAFLPTVVRPEDFTRCPNCTRPVLKGSQSCPHCSEPMPIDMVECKACGKFVPEGSRCSECGAPL